MAVNLVLLFVMTTSKTGCGAPAPSLFINLSYDCFITAMSLPFHWFCSIFFSVKIQAYYTWFTVVVVAVKTVYTLCYFKENFKLVIPISFRSSNLIFIYNYWYYITYIIDLLIDWLILWIWGCTPVPINIPKKYRFTRYENLMSSILRLNSGCLVHNPRRQEHHISGTRQINTNQSS